MAFRSLSRLSSALGAKASTLRSFLLNFLLQCVALHCFVLLSHLSMIPYLSFDRRVRDFSRHRICFFDVLLIINGYLLSLCMKFSRYIRVTGRSHMLSSWVALTYLYSYAFEEFPLQWSWGDSNPWPPACKAGALPTELHPQNLCDTSGNASSLGLFLFQNFKCANIFR